MTINKRKNDQTPLAAMIILAFMFMGIGLIFALNLGFWPWIMLVVGTSVLAEGMLNPEKLGEKLQGVVWLYGIFVVALTGYWWPGMLFLVGLSLLMKALLGPQFQAVEEKRKPKRGMPLPPEGDDEY